MSDLFQLLFLDDCPNRCKKFRSSCPYATIVHTAVDAIARIEAQHWDIVSLDHDLGGEAYVDSKREDCGMEVVRFIVANQPKIHKVIVHSSNGPARLNMVSLLKQAGYVVQDASFLNFWTSGIVDGINRARDNHGS